jgi:hypothetical protein
MNQKRKKENLILCLLKILKNLNLLRHFLVRNIIYKFLLNNFLGRKNRQKL